MRKSTTYAFGAALFVLTMNGGTTHARCDLEYNYDPESEADAVSQRLCEIEFKLEELAQYTRNVDAYLRAICSHYPEDCLRAKEGKQP